jgi:type I restriction enzyme M protein
MFEQVFKDIDNILHEDAGCGSELDYVEQSSWIIFLKYLDDMGHSKSMEAILKGEAYQAIIADKFRWANWATQKTAEGKPHQSHR